MRQGATGSGDAASAGKWTERAGRYQLHLEEVAELGGAAALMRSLVKSQLGLEKPIDGVLPFLPDAQAGRKVSAKTAGELLLGAAKENRERALAAGRFPSQTAGVAPSSVGELMTSDLARDLGEVLEEVFTTFPGSRELFVEAVERRSARALPGAA
ncbi:hypothetical protein [Streptomyces ehimensis]|uniref:DUF2267 domain-containing protein n=1 Tax=Streptomyces ehimensis TaxID=68195 RepID=A0ABV9BU67_9ACTN